MLIEQFLAQIEEGFAVVDTGLSMTLCLIAQEIFLIHVVGDFGEDDDEGVFTNAFCLLFGNNLIRGIIKHHQLLDPTVSVLCSTGYACNLGPETV